MKRKIPIKKFTSEQIQQISEIDLTSYFQGRLSVFGITIDDATTVDRDDGIWLIDLNNGNFELQVSITDVSAIIPKNSPVDKEAFKRVATLYHTTPVTPMLPCGISTNLGSLEEGEKRLALTVFFEINNEGKVNSFCIKETIFSSLKAFNYDEVEKILVKPGENFDDKLLVKMQQLSHLLGKGRMGKSGILTTEGYVDEDGNLIKENINTHQLIAELMILTNTTIANFLAEKKVNALYRTQDVGIENLQQALKEMGHCLVPATYASSPLSHVGLGLPVYCHFTSPLRRFVDLVNHRIIKALIHQEKSSYNKDELDKIAEYVNDFQQQYKLDKANYLRIKRQKDLDEKFGRITTEEITQLSNEEFSDLIQYSAFRQKTQLLIAEIQKRFDQLLPKDLYFLWFVGKVDLCLEREEIDAISVMLIKSQLDNVTINYQIEYCDLRKIYFSYCYLNGLTTLNPVFDTKKVKAKNKSALATIKAYINDELTTNPNPIPIPNHNPNPSVNCDDISELKITPKTTNNDIPEQIVSISNLEIPHLSEKEFSKVLDYAIKTKKIEADFLAEIEKRIKRLQPKDLYQLWFTAKINCFLDYPNFDAISVLVIHSQLTGAKVEYQIDYHFETESFIASCYVDGLTSPIIEIDTKKARVKQKSALAYIKSYLNNDLTSEPEYLEIDKKQEIIEDLDDIISEINLEINELESDIEKDNELECLIIIENKSELIEDDVDWVSILNQFCQKQQIDYPTYDFINVDGFFYCTIKLNYLDQIISDQGYGKSKKEAKKNASKLLMTQLNLVRILN